MAAVVFVMAGGTLLAGEVDPRLPGYQTVSGVSGSIKSTGSDTMNNLMTLWAEGFKRLYPNVEVEIEGKGSSTAPPALIAGTSTFGPMSRMMKSKEQDAFEKRFGYKATQLPTSIDMLAVYVHRDNPIAKKGLTIQQVDAMFFKTRKLGYPKDIKTWGDLGLTGEWARLPISLYGRNAASGTYGYFKKHVGGGGDYKDEVKEQPGSSAVVQGVASEKGGIGYSGIGYKTADVAVVPLAPTANDKPVPATAETVEDYPLARFLYLTVNKKPGAPLDPLRREFLKYVFCKPGQQVVIKDGYLPLTFELCKKALASVDIELQPAR
jgi:phosphate transport system substrate-binding protein